MIQSKEGSEQKTATVSIGEHQIELEIVFSQRAQLTISVHPDMRITARAPLGSSITEVRERVRKKSAWIIRQLHYFEKFQPLPTKRQYVSGETHLFFGRQYRLKVVSGPLESVKLKGRYFWVRTESPEDKTRIEFLISKWYHDRASVILGRRLESIVESAHKTNIPNPSVKFRKMKKRWGSCAKSGMITLNSELIKAPVYCIDYVIAHELCHLRHRNHGPSFWRLLSRIMPDWGKRKLRLEEILI